MDRSVFIMTETYKRTQIYKRRVIGGRHGDRTKDKARYTFYAGAQNVVK